MSSSTSSAVCTRCHQTGHRAAECTRMSFMKQCAYCKNIGHNVAVCPALRQKEMKNQRVSSQRKNEHVRSTTPLASIAKNTKDVAVDRCSDTESTIETLSGNTSPMLAEAAENEMRNPRVCSQRKKEHMQSVTLSTDVVKATKDTAVDMCSDTESTAASLSGQVGAMLRGSEDNKESRKYEKLLRDIARISERQAAGEKLDALQLQKLTRKEEAEKALMMVKIQVGLTDSEEKEARKYEKLLREIARISERQAAGEKLDDLQLQKLTRKQEAENSFVMMKMQAGCARRS